MRESIAGKRLSQRVPGRTVWRNRLLGVLLLVSIAALAVVLAALHRPAWYRPAAIDYGRLHADKAALVSLQDEISAGLNAGRAVHFQVPEDQVNRWLAARAELWPEVLFDLGGLDAPWVSFAGGELRVAATIRRGVIRGVVALTGRVEVTDDAVVVYCDRVHLGALPVPQTWVSEALANVRGAGDAISWDGARTLTLRNEWVWPNGKRHCRLREFQAANGVADIVLEPLPARRY